MQKELEKLEDAELHERLATAIGRQERARVSALQWGDLREELEDEIRRRALLPRP